MSEDPQGVMIESEVEGAHDDLKSMHVYWHPYACLDDPPYRKIVRWMMEAWRERFEVALLSEPPEEKDEDFIVHELSLDDRPLSIYWENSLGYISLQAHDESLLREAAGVLKGMKPSL